MKIIRNGIGYELTREEMREAYEIMKSEYLREDIKFMADEKEINLPDDTMDYIIGKVEKSLGNNDSYMESYWITIEYVLEDL